MLQSISQAKGDLVTAPSFQDCIGISANSPTPRPIPCRMNVELHSAEIPHAAVLAIVARWMVVFLGSLIDGIARRRVDSAGGSSGGLLCTGEALHLVEQPLSNG